MGKKAFAVSSAWVLHAHADTVDQCELCRELICRSSENAITYLPLQRRDLLAEVCDTAVKYHTADLYVPPKLKLYVPQLVVRLSEVLRH